MRPHGLWLSQGQGRIFTESTGSGLCSVVCRRQLNSTVRSRCSLSLDNLITTSTRERQVRLCGYCAVARCSITLYHHPILHLYRKLSSFSSSVTSLLFHSRLEAQLFHKSFPPLWDHRLFPTHRTHFPDCRLFFIDFAYRIYAADGCRSPSLYFASVFLCASNFVRSPLLSTSVCPSVCQTRAP